MLILIGRDWPAYLRSYEYASSFVGASPSSARRDEGCSVARRDGGEGDLGQGDLGDGDGARRRDLREPTTQVSCVQRVGEVNILVMSHIEGFQSIPTHVLKGV